jgi:nucleotide-binding universal stress UspA family protein
MIATDGSEGANRALDVAADIAKVTGSTLSILTVGGNLSGDEMRQLAEAEKDVGAALDSMPERILIDARRRAEKIGAPEISTEVKWGDAAPELDDLEFLFARAAARDIVAAAMRTGVGLLGGQRSASDTGNWGHRRCCA